MSRPPRLDLLIPGLFGPVLVHHTEVPPTPVLSRLLGQADRLPVAGSPDPCRTLFHLFGYTPASELDCPSAPYCRLADFQTEDLGTGPEPYVLHADPVHLRPDRDRLVLFAGPDFAPDRAEADALVNLFNQHLGDEGLRLEAPTPERWYLLSEQPPQLVTQPLAAVLGRPIAGHLPQGPEARRWARLLNEVQMLFHHSEVNQRREAAGIPTLNGLWLWGGGRLLPPPGRVAYKVVFGADPLVRGLARASGIPTTNLPTDPATLLAVAVSSSTPTPTSSPPGAVLIRWHGLWEAVVRADAPSWLAALSALEQWLSGLTAGSGVPGPAGAPLTRGATPRLRLDLDLYPANGERFHHRPYHRYRFWRHPIALVRPGKGSRESP